MSAHCCATHCGTCSGRESLACDMAQHGSLHTAGLGTKSESLLHGNRCTQFLGRCCLPSCGTTQLIGLTYSTLPRPHGVIIVWYGRLIDFTQPEYIPCQKTHTLEERGQCSPTSIDTPCITKFHCLKIHGSHSCGSAEEHETSCVNTGLQEFNLGTQWLTT